MFLLLGQLGSGAPVTKYTLTGKNYLADDVWSLIAGSRSPSGVLGDIYVEGGANGAGGTDNNGGGGGGSTAGGRITPVGGEAINIPPVGAVDTNGEDFSFGSLIVAKAGFRGNSAEGSNAGKGGLASASTGTWKRDGGNATLGSGIKLGGAGAGRKTAAAGTVPGNPNGGRSTSTTGGGKGAGGGSNTGSASQGRRGWGRALWQIEAVAGAVRLVGISETRIDADATSIVCEPLHDGEGNVIDYTGLYIVAVVGLDGAPASITEGSGAWGSRAAVSNSTSCTAKPFYIKQAAGTETLTVTLSAAEQGEVHMFAFADADPTQELEWDTATGTSNAPNPPSHSPTGGSGKRQWVCGCVCDGNPDCTGFPSGYEDQTHTPGGNTTGVVLCSGHRYADTDNQNPSAYAFDNGFGGAASPPWVAYTFSIRPLVVSGGAGPSTVGVAAWGDSETALANSWRGPFWERAQASSTLRVDFVPIKTSGLAVNPPCDDADNGGFPGETIEQITTRISAYSGPQPGIVVMMAGANNVNAGDDAATMLTKAGLAMDALKAKHTVARDAGQIRWVALQYGNGGNPAMTAGGVAGAFNAGLPALCASKGIRFVDQNNDQGGTYAMPWNPTLHATDPTGHQNDAGGRATGACVAEDCGI